jgi:hypothetical protein
MKNSLLELNIFIAFDSIAIFKLKSIQLYNIQNLLLLAEFAITALKKINLM